MIKTFQKVGLGVNTTGIQFLNFFSKLFFKYLN